jgi:citrate lyase beta subunit
MKYLQDGINYVNEPVEFNKYSDKQLLQYAVGGLLYMPATHIEIADKIINHTYKHLKSMVLDLEDSVGDDLVTKAEKCAISTIHRLYQAISSNAITINELPLVFIRVRTPEQMQRIYNTCKDELSIITGFVFPKVDKYNCDNYINSFMEIRHKVNTDLYMMPIIESKNAMYRQLRMDNLLYVNDQLKLINENVLNIRIGVADFCNIFGIRRSINNTVWDVNVIADCLADIYNVFGRNYVVSSGVWKWFGGENAHTKWESGLITEVQADLTNGLFGKTCIHPTQLEPVQRQLIVNENDYRDAVNMLSTTNNLTAVTKGTENKMNEIKTQLKWARKTLTISEVYGVC